MPNDNGLGVVMEGRGVRCSVVMRGGEMDMRYGADVSHSSDTNPTVL